MRTPRTHVSLRLVAVAAIVVALAAWARTAHAQADSTSTPAGGARLTSLHDKFQVNASLTGVLLNANIRLDGENLGIGTELDAEDDLGLDKFIPEPRFALRWRPGTRHELEAGYQWARRNAEKRLERTIDFGDSTYEAGLDVRSVLDTDQAFLNYRFALFDKPNWQAGPSVGLGALFLTMGLAAEANVGLSQAAFDVEKSITGPLGSLGIYGRLLSGDRWFFEADARAIGIQIDRFDVLVLEANLATRYFLSRDFGLEAGFGMSSVEVDIARKEDQEFSASGRVEYSLENFRLGVVWVP